MEGSKKEGPLHAQNVVVLAENFQLTQAQHELLNKGLTFVPTVNIHRNQKWQLQLDMQNYHRKIKLATYFRKAPQKDRIPFLGPSEWTPPPRLLPIETRELIERDQQIFKKHYKFIFQKPNISLREAKALRELKNNKQIVIKPADKGSAVVVMGREQYIMEVKRQLEDTNYYKKILKPLYLDTVPLIGDILDRLKNKKFINERQRQYLAGQRQPRQRRFYALPKIHKHPNSWTVPHKIPPGRPIVSDCGSESYCTAQYLDYFLNPLSTLHESYIKDTYSFIKLIKTLRIRADFYLFTLDVESLYTNIPIEEGIECVKRLFEEHPDPKRPDAELLELLRINLTLNDFVFDKQFYLQIKGTAMGKRFAPAYANIYMASWEQGALAKCIKKPALYVRYLDDIFGLWVGSKAEFDTFIGTLNSYNSSIKLKFQIERDSIDFLDTTVYRGPNFDRKRKLDIKVFFKSTDTHALLQKGSHHPKHTFRGIVKSQLIRFRRICTRTQDFLQATRVLFGALRARGYVRSFLRNCFRTFKNRTVREKKDLLPLITTYSQVARVMNSKIKRNFQSAPNRDQWIPNVEVISAYRRHRNLKDWLVRADLPSNHWERPLKRQKHFHKVHFIKNNTNRTVIKISQDFSLRSKNCVYIISCTKCLIQYIGETKNNLYTRLSQHIYNINNRKELSTLLVKHFIQHGVDSLRISGIEGNVCWSDRDRKRRERFWIFTVGTREPGGLNMKK